MHDSLACSKSRNCEKIHYNVFVEAKLKKYLKRGRFDNVSYVRSRTMAAIRGKNNRTTEVRLKMALVRNRIKGYQLHPSHLPGKPDFYFKGKKTAIFVDGCFWHGCPRCGHIPKTRTSFWAAKIERNKKRDVANKRKLKSNGIYSLRIWEHEVKNEMGLSMTMAKIKDFLKRRSS